MKFVCPISSRGLFAQLAVSAAPTCGQTSTGAQNRSAAQILPKGNGLSGGQGPSH